MSTRKNTRTRIPLFMAALVSLVGMSGCLDQGVDKLTDPLAPIAVLHVDRETRFVGEAFTFDAQASSDPNGNITKWIFDFGDGTTVEVETEDEARVKHAYELGGVYDVTLTVVDDGAKQSEPLNTTKVTQVIVDERHVLGPMLMAAAPDNSSETARASQTFNATATAERFELDLAFENQALIASSRIQVRIVDPDGNIVVEETMTLDPNETEEISFDETLASEGIYTIEIVAESGASDATGELRILHAPLDETV